MDNSKSKIQTKLTFDDNVIKKIAGLASRNVDGVLSLEGGMLSNLGNRFRSDSDPTQGVDAQVGEQQVAISLNIVIEYGKDMRQVFQQVCQRVQQDLERLTGLEVIEINVQVDDVMSKQEWQAQASGKPNSTVDTENKVK
ncbi:Asp23/Gls24 family envelope stress response protein [Lentilactobacillus senioris]|uniref:Stress response regulator gls24 homolog n=1 Tax=Lentilactobacillus senioris DSM 24302 = JCM 17472 TaxID=1423802 RepID=A0A0R2D1N0_9LACO|nr:Asp23/Gls24 family envelope stress response protein [Lentilactobacillus senioris]KRM93980.1 hypothetical protein FC56_GL000701 [Lentilactobacillus senioris DSM 24302 = JCM 17472]MCY9806990.1 Asp23/Gls24 family envelope stress response protein [Lentilactobacillus senioris]